MKVFIKGVNPCLTRSQNLLHWKTFLLLNNHEVVSSIKDSDIILFWTCGYRGDTVENSISEVKRCKKQYKDKIIIVGGCLPSIDKERVEQLGEVAMVPWKGEGQFFDQFFRIEGFTFDEVEPIFCEEPKCKEAAEYRKAHPDKDALFADQFLKLHILRGCPYNCTYCTEKLAFPPLRSAKPDSLIRACYDPIQKGYNSIMFLGDCVGQYGRDIQSSLPELMMSLETKYPQVTFAIQHLHPLDFLRLREQLEEFILNGTIIHMNIPIQSASDTVLSKMNRGYTKKDISYIFNYLTKLDFHTYDTHILIGFPGETTENFEETLIFLKEHEPRYALVSKYYDAPRADSYKFEDKVSKKEIDHRADLLREMMKAEGIVYNIDGDEFMQDRFSRINKVGE